jgi:hypothetical protein
MDSMENQHQIETIYQCPQCNSQGEVMIDEPRFKNIQKERDLLSVAHIRKLEEEIDMLRKQKIYLQSKLREKGKLKVKTLINRLLNYDMEHDVELIILGEDEDDWQKGIHVHYQMILLMDMVEIIVQ